MFLQQLKNITVVTVTGDLMNSSPVGGEGHVPVIAHLHFPHGSQQHDGARKLFSHQEGSHG